MTYGHYLNTSLQLYNICKIMRCFLIEMQVQINPYCTTLQDLVVLVKKDAMSKNLDENVLSGSVNLRLKNNSLLFSLEGKK